MAWSGRTVVPLAMAAVAVAFLVQVHEILLPFVLAATQAYLLNPLVRFFEVRGLRRGPVVAVLYAILVTATSIGLYSGMRIITVEAEEASLQMPVYVEKGEQFLHELKRAADDPARATARVQALYEIPLMRPLLANTRLLAWLNEHGRTWPQDILAMMPSMAPNVMPLLQIGFLVPFIAFFLMQEGHAMRDAALRWIPSRYVEMALNIVVEIDNSFGKYIRGICLEAFVVGMLAFGGFALIGLDYAAQIAVVVGLANIVPYVGPVIGGIIGSGVALFQWSDPTKILYVVAVCAGVRFIEDWAVQPVVLRHAVHLHPVLILFSLMAGAHLFGFWGLLFGVPAACMVKVLASVTWTWYASQYGLRSHLPLPDAVRIPLV